MLMPIYEFCEKCGTFKCFSKAIGRLGGTSMKQECDLLKTKPLDQTNKEIIMEIKHSNEEIEQLKKSVQSLKRSQEEDRRTVKRLKTSHKNVVSENEKGQDNTVMPEIPALTQLTTSLNNMEQTVQNQGTLIQSLLVRESNISSQPAFVSDINNGAHHDTGSYHTAKVSSGMFPHVQAVAPNVRKQILEGKYINLATLLNNQENVQDYKTVDESDGSVLLIKHRDPRLQRNLSIQEFLEAFNIYKNIICEKARPTNRIRYVYSRYH
ncbi:unnamed protein product [Mytilus edulis]|uniref:Uncharacterized protein n=1 Tax=Mytilus edulis TaxID=6550 RepID=A0A8S3QSJ8_MYTED|nr:unnamed protein product [Mytilus edulis]